LPEAPELDIGQALIAEPEPSFVDVAHNAEVIADEGANNDEKRHPEQEIDQHGLTLGFTPAYGRGQEQRGADPRQADPDNRSLDMHIAQEVERQDAIHLDAVK